MPVNGSLRRRMRMFAVGYPSRRPSCSPAHHAAAHRIRPAQQVARAAKSAAASAVRTPLELTRMSSMHTDGTSSSSNLPRFGRRAQQRDAARTAAPETKILAHHHRRRREALGEQLHELLAGELTQLLVEAQHAHVVQVRTLEHPPALAKIREPRRRILRRREVLARQRLEGQHHRRLRELLREPAGARDQRAVPQVNAVEAADRDGGAAMFGLQALQAADEFHGDYAPATLRTWRKRVPASNSAAK